MNVEYEGVVLPHTVTRGFGGRFVLTMTLVVWLHWRSTWTELYDVDDNFTSHTGSAVEGNNSCTFNVRIRVLQVSVKTKLVHMQPWMEISTQYHLRYNGHKWKTKSTTLHMGTKPLNAYLVLCCITCTSVHWATVNILHDAAWRGYRGHKKIKHYVCTYFCL